VKKGGEISPTKVSVHSEVLPKHSDGINKLIISWGSGERVSVGQRKTPQAGGSNLKKKHYKEGEHYRKRTYGGRALKGKKRAPTLWKKAIPYKAAKVAKYLSKKPGKDECEKKQKGRYFEFAIDRVRMLYR